MPIEQPKQLQYNVPQTEVRYVASKQTTKQASTVPPSIRPYDSNVYAFFKPTRINELSVSTHRYLPIKHMRLFGPQWWQTSDLPGTPPAGYNLRLNPKGDKETELTFASAGCPAPEDSALRDILKNRPHRLTKKELNSISNVLKEARSENMNGKMVVIETGYFDKEGKQVYRIEFNQNPDSTELLVPATISFIAKPNKYKQYLGAVLASLKTIRWDEKAHLAP